MTIEEIKENLMSRNTILNTMIKDELERMKADAVLKSDEDTANELWCYEQIYSIQKDYYSAFANMKKAIGLSDEFDDEGYNSPKSRAYENAWNELDHSDMTISSLERNFCIRNADIEDFHISEIEDNIQKMFPLFPYRVFTSREEIIKREECSICGKTISIRKPCGHIVGKLYMGEMCCRRVVDFDFLNVNIVSKPFDRYAIMKPQGVKFNFMILDFIIPRIKPYSQWSYEVEKRLLPQYKKIGRNDRCPCGSGKKFKYCIRDEKYKHYEDHYVFSV